MAATCFRAGVIGHMSVDFVTLVDEEQDGALRLWAVDLALHPTPSLMAFQLFDFLTVGTFDPANGTYCVELEPPPQEEDEGQADGVSSVGEAATKGSLLSEPPTTADGSAGGSSLLLAGERLARVSETSLSLSAQQPPTSAGGEGGALLPEDLQDQGLVLGETLLAHHPGAPPAMSPPQADPAMLGLRPPTADLPSGLPSIRGSSSSSPSTRPTTGPGQGSQRGSALALSQEGPLGAQQGEADGLSSGVKIGSLSFSAMQQQVSQQAR